MLARELGPTIINQETSTLKKTTIRAPFDKYHYYSLSVQSPESDVSFMFDTYRDLRSKKATVLREDFCGALVLHRILLLR